MATDFTQEYRKLDDHDLKWTFERLQIKISLLRQAVEQDCRGNIEDTPLAESIQLYSERYWACERELIERGLYDQL